MDGSIPDLSGMQGLVRIKLQNNYFTDGIPTWFGDMASLVYLYLHYNPLGGTIPSELGDMASLRYLWLHNNQLTGGVPPELSRLSNLWDFNLHTNKLSGPIPDLSGMSSLTRLRLHRNMISGNIPASLGDLDSLQFMWLHGNVLSGSIPADLGNLRRLERLWLSENSLTGVIPEELGNLSDHSLVQWRLADNQLTGCLPEGLKAVEDNDLAGLGLAVCGEEPEVVDPTPVSMTIAAGEAAVVTHDSGAQIEIPAGTTTESATVSITEVTPPETILSVGRTFDFAVTNASGEDVELQGPVTLRLPYSLSEGKNEADVAVLRWNEDVRRWEAVHGGVADGATRMVTVRSPRLSAKNTGGRGTSRGDGTGHGEHRRVQHTHGALR